MICIRIEKWNIMRADIPTNSFMMNNNMTFLLKKIVLGFLSGIIYALVNFNLLTPYLRNNYSEILFWGIQGSIFFLTHALFIRVFRSNKFFQKKNIRPKITSVIFGGGSGFIASLFSISLAVLGFYSSTSADDIYVPTESIVRLFSELGCYSMGWIAIGTFAGYFLRDEAAGWPGKRRKEEEKRVEKRGSNRKRR